MNMKVNTKKNFTLWMLALVLFVVFVTQNLQAQSNIRLTGRVYDAESGTPLSGVNVQLETTALGAVSDDNGYFSIENVPPGTYSVVFSMLGYENKTRTSLAVTEASPRQLSINLEPAAIRGDSVIVVAHREEGGVGIEGDKIVLKGAEIDRYRSLGLPQLLQQVAGVQVESTGGGASLSTIKIHGGSANQVLVLLDGQRLNKPHDGAVDLNEIPLEQVEKIEVIRQGNTAIYGGNAFSGVVSFRTRQIKQGSNNGILRSQAGSFSTVMGSATAELYFRQTGLIANYQQDYSRQNFNYIYEGEKYARANAWYRNQKLFLKFNCQFNRHQFSVLYNYRRGEQGLPSAFYEEMHNFNAYREGASQTLQIQDRWLAGSKGFIEGNIAYHHLDQLYNNENDLSPFTRYKTRQVNEVIEPKVTVYYNPASLLESRWGAQYLEEKLDQQNLLFPDHGIGEKQRNTKGAYGSAEIKPQALKHIFKTVNFRSALRYEQYFDQPWTWYPLVGMSIAPEVLPALSISSSWGKAVRYPDFNSLFWKGDARARGNPDLLPERKEFWNLSARFQTTSLFLPALSVFYYSEDIRDLIFWHRGVNGVWEPRNESQAKKRGWDVQVDQNLLPEKLHFQVSYSRVDARNKSEEPNRQNKRIVFTPEHTINASLWYQIGRIHSLVVYRYVSEREIVPANTGNPLPEYQLWDFSISWQQPLHKLLIDLGFAVKNITNSNYELLRGYPMPGREFQFSIQLKYGTN
jgi:outer membrane receptor for ferrienterochelin and colicins